MFEEKSDVSLRCKGQTMLFKEIQYKIEVEGKINLQKNSKNKNKN